MQNETMHGNRYDRRCWSYCEVYENDYLGPEYSKIREPDDEINLRD